jgi:hypothetical protein
MTTKILFVITALFTTGCLTQDETFASRAVLYKQPGTVILSWAPSSGNPQGYKVEISTDGINFNQVQMVTIPTATITGVPASATYYFRVRSYNEAGDSGYSAIIPATLK